MTEGVHNSPNLDLSYAYLFSVCSSYGHKAQHTIQKWY